MGVSQDLSDSWTVVLFSTEIREHRLCAFIAQCIGGLVRLALLIYFGECS
jgi:hypothetical protein